MKNNDISTIEAETKTREKIFSVSEFLDFINSILFPQKVIVEGEIGEKIDEREKYITFNLLDKKDKSVLKCFLWRETLDVLGVKLKEGLEIRVFGFPRIFKSKYGTSFEFEVEKIWLLGEGILKQAFEALKKKLEAEGLFDPRFKKPIPKFCQKIGLITSKYGKGAKPDFEKNLGKFGFKVYFFDVRVEGIFAVEEIVEAIRWFNENLPDLDILVLIRGGGDWESLQAFNSEKVVRAIFASKIPVICGVGHESDYTLADFVADLRVSTPTEAAKVLTQSWLEARQAIKNFKENLNSNFLKILRKEKDKLSIFENQFNFHFAKEISNFKKELFRFEQSFSYRFSILKEKLRAREREFKKNLNLILKLLQKEREKTKMLEEGLKKSKTKWLEKLKEKLKEREKTIFTSSPLYKLKQGFTITFNEKGKLIKNVKELNSREKIKTKFFKGQVVSQINKILENE